MTHPPLCTTFGIRSRRWRALGTTGVESVTPARRSPSVKTLAFVFGLCISAVGLIGILVPSGLLWLAHNFVSSGTVGFYVIATVRIAFGLMLISVASASRAPKRVRILGYVILLLGITTALTGLVAVQRGGAVIDWWSHQRSGVWRLTGGFIVALGAFVAYACSPARRAA
jgi:hypothetical protein